MSHLASENQILRNTTLPISDGDYDRLKQLTRRLLRGGWRGLSMSPTDIVHVALLKLVETPPSFRDSVHAFCTAVHALRQTLVDAARRRKTLRRNLGRRPQSLGDSDCARSDRDERLLVLDELLSRLARDCRDRAHILELRYFAGLSMAQIAQLVGYAKPTVEREYRSAIAWLLAEFRKAGWTECAS